MADLANFYVRPLAFDVPGVGPVHDQDGREVFGVFNNEDDDVYCHFTGSRLECNTQAREWNDAIARGQSVRLPAGILRYF